MDDECCGGSGDDCRCQSVITDTAAKDCEADDCECTTKEAENKECCNGEGDCTCQDA